MPKFNRILLITLLSIPGVIVSYMLFFILGNILIPDECYYETHASNWFIELMFDFPSWNGCHPFPSTFQFMLIILFGIYLSYLFCKRRLKV